MDLASLLRAIGEPRAIMLQSERTLNNSDRYLLFSVRFNYIEATTTHITTNQRKRPALVSQVSISSKLYNLYTSSRSKLIYR